MKKTFAGKEKAKKADILIVEDDSLVAISMKFSLIKLGYNVTSVVTSGVEAIRKTETDKPDLILMDVFIDGIMDGIETCRRINSFVQTPIIYITANSDHGTLKRMKTSCFYGCLIKPFKNEELDMTIEKALCKSKMERLSG